MYIPKHFDIEDREEWIRFIEANAFGQLISNDENGRPFSSHVPFLLSEDKLTIRGHLARQNPQCLSADGQEVLVSLQGPHAYVSPSWYQAPGVPTWNYQALHIYGVCRFTSDVEKIKTIVDSLTEKCEAGFDQPWQAEYRSAMLGAICGFDIEISEIQCKYKLSQNRSDEDRAGVIQQLEKTNGRLARVMGRALG